MCGLYDQLRKRFTPYSLYAGWQDDVRHGADGETILGYLLDFVKDTYGIHKTESYSVCQKFIKDLGFEL